MCVFLYMRLCSETHIDDESFMSGCMDNEQLEFLGSPVWDAQRGISNL